MAKKQDFKPVTNWLKFDQDEVFDEFLKIPGAFSDYKDEDHQFVYIEGDRDDRVLLVAHADTVWGNNQVQLAYHGNVIYSKLFDTEIFKPGRLGNTKIKSDGLGIGADDRAGCAILWELKELGHSLLITSGEERGCLTSKWLMKSDWWKKELNNHQFMIQFDRRGARDIVFYRSGTKEFAKYLKEQSRYKINTGFSTDIRHLAEDVCAANISVGYYAEHMPAERLDFTQWLNTLETFRSILQQKELPKFALVQSDLYTEPKSYHHYNEDYWSGNMGGGRQAYANWHKHHNQHNRSNINNNHNNSGRKKAKPKTQTPDMDIETFVCESCGCVLTVDELIMNDLVCMHC